MGDERDEFNRLVKRYGQISTSTRRLADSLTYDGDCWTFAWRAAQELDGRYFEGMCKLPMDGRNTVVRAHAWTEVDSPFGTVLIESTRGYEQAHSYLGIQVDATPLGYVDIISKQWPDDERASVIEALIVNGYTTEQIFEMIRTPAGGYPS